MQCLCFDVAFFCNFSKINCWIDIPFRAISSNLCHSKMQVFAGRSCTRISGNT